MLLGSSMARNAVGSFSSPQFVRIANDLQSAETSKISRLLPVQELRPIQVIHNSIPMPRHLKLSPTPNATPSAAETRLTTVGLEISSATTLGLRRQRSGPSLQEALPGLILY